MKILMIIPTKSGCEVVKEIEIRSHDFPSAEVRQVYETARERARSKGDWYRERLATARSQAEREAMAF